MKFDKNSNPKIKALCEFMAPITHLQSIDNLLSWDQEADMPIAAYKSRSEQLATLKLTIQEKLNTGEAYKLFAELDENDNSYTFEEQKMIKCFKKEYKEANIIPPELYKKLGQQLAISIESWKKATKANDFKLFAPALRNVIETRREIIKLFPEHDHPYDVLLTNYEEGLTTANLDKIFEDVKDKTIKLYDIYKKKKIDIDRSFLFQNYSKEKQYNLVKVMARRLSFDFSRGNLDISVFPHTTAMNIDDVRISTRIKRDDIRQSTYGILHELGHGLYEQGISRSLKNTFAAGASSNSIHESQAHILENNIARSYEFCLWFMPLLKDHFPDKLEWITATEAFKSINKVTMENYRTEADELTYTLHIILRYKIEKAIFERDIRIDDIPNVWNELSRKYLGFAPKSDNEGCLQDIHWAAGLFGYFPTYLLGKLYAAMFWSAMQKDIPDYREKIVGGEFYVLRNWLKENIHKWGKIKSPSELCNDICGEDLNPQYYLDYIKNKLDQVYS